MKTKHIVGGGKLISASSHRRSMSRWLFSAIAFGTFVVLPVESQAYNICDDKIEFGEPHDAFTNLQYGLMGHILAEKICGAPPTPFAPKYLGAVERDGCLPGTAVYLDMKKWIAEAEKFGSEVTQEQARALVDELGGCDAVIEVHNAQIPPLVLDDSGPAPPGSRDINR